MIQIHWKSNHDVTRYVPLNTIFELTSITAGGRVRVWVSVSVSVRVSVRLWL